ncbi:MAG: hypothetical protein HY703_07480 [Gemmatimonadetes bacterium]|nr:hypothetical protein [Gemmatimonadota bacterium]
MEVLSREPESAERPEEASGIVILDRGAPPSRPVIAAFIWGGKVRPVPTLPYGRWKPASG